MVADPAEGGSGSVVLSVVVAGRVHEADPRLCLEAIHQQRDRRLEVVLVTDGPAPQYAGVDRQIRGVGALVPELWAEGIRVATGDVVALTVASMVPGAGWIAAIRAAHGRPGRVVGGPIEPGPLVRAVDWAVYFCRYSTYLRPLAPGLEVPGDNASYDAGLLRAHRSAWSKGFWEPFVHHEMRAAGVSTDMVDDMVVEMQPGAALRSFSRQRFAHGLRHGRNVGRSEGRTTGVIRVLAAPAVPLVMLGRVRRAVPDHHRYRPPLTRSTPYLLWFFSCWAAGEAVGRLRSLIARR